ncbi:hypothetical protein [Bacillus sp. JJ722]|uniref:hypothetical protein n=1 Tax=Bacillus sp. JJ722 TaxID=3122973 RepID=UPI002FFEA2F6
MKRTPAIQADENVIATVSGLFECFNGEQNYYFGDLLLTNKRLYIFGKAFLGLSSEQSLWFNLDNNEEMRKIKQNTFFVGNQSIKVQWLNNGDSAKFADTFENLNLTEIEFINQK